MLAGRKLDGREIGVLRTTQLWNPTTEPSTSRTLRNSRAPSVDASHPQTSSLTEKVLQVVRAGKESLKLTCRERSREIDPH
jgi:hypothetical protein